MALLENVTNRETSRTTMVGLRWQRSQPWAEANSQADQRRLRFGHSEIASLEAQPTTLATIAVKCFAKRLDRLRAGLLGLFNREFPTIRDSEYRPRICQNW